MVDLDKLSAELTAAGLKIDHTSDDLFAAGGWMIWGDGTFSLYDTESDFATICDTANIIRRHVAPVAPDPGLREAIAKALCSHFCGPDDNPDDEWMTNAVKSVMDVLAERGMA